ncbi:MAG: GIY-YIG nuclease family protein [bacterium]|nr:GIY-YIG nuclease family protein [bacterium]
MYFVYLILCQDDTIYTGITTNVVRRVKEHRVGEGSRYMRAKKFKKLLYTEKFPTRSAASKREAEIKSWDKKDKLKLVK